MERLDFTTVLDYFDAIVVIIGIKKSEVFNKIELNVATASLLNKEWLDDTFYKDLQAELSVWGDVVRELEVALYQEALAKIKEMGIEHQHRTKLADIEADPEANAFACLMDAMGQKIISLLEELEEDIFSEIITLRAEYQKAILSRTKNE